MTLADEDTNSILTDKANRAILSNEVMQLESDANLKIDVTARLAGFSVKFFGFIGFFLDFSVIFLRFPCEIFWNSL